MTDHVYRGLWAISVHCWQAGYLVPLVARTALARETLWFGLYIVSVSANVASPFVCNHWDGGRKRLADIYCVSSSLPGYWVPFVLNNQGATWWLLQKSSCFGPSPVVIVSYFLFRPPSLWTSPILQVPYQNIHYFPGVNVCSYLGHSLSHRWVARCVTQTSVPGVPLSFQNSLWGIVVKKLSIISSQNILS